MAFPKIIILAQGGTHGDFLYQSCQIITSTEDSTKINDKGKVNESSIFKRKNLNVFEKGEKKNTMLNHLDDARPIEICHVWYKEFIDWPSKFYYIDFDDSLIEIIKKMYFEKVCNNDKDIAIEYYKKYLPDSIARKINHSNFDEIFNMSYKSIKKKYKKQPDIKAINMIDLYSLPRLIDILKDMTIYDEKKFLSLKIFHSEWIERNDKWIKQVKKLTG